MEENFVMSYNVRSFQPDLSILFF